jgi:hypothetical protein
VGITICTHLSKCWSETAARCQPVSWRYLELAHSPLVSYCPCRHYWLVHWHYCGSGYSATRRALVSRRVHCLRHVSCALVVLRHRSRSGSGFVDLWLFGRASSRVNRPLLSWQGRTARLRCRVGLFGLLAASRFLAPGRLGRLGWCRHSLAHSNSSGSSFNPSGLKPGRLPI